MRYAYAVSTLDKVLVHALALPGHDRIQLARKLLESVDEAELSVEDEAELVRRIDEIESGGETIAGATLLEALRTH